MTGFESSDDRLSPHGFNREGIDGDQTTDLDRVRQQIKAMTLSHFFNLKPEHESSRGWALHSQQDPAQSNFSRILLVACQHGDEVFGAQLMQVIDHEPELQGKVDTILANPEAYRLGKRFVDEDMNQVFRLGESGASYERKRADEIARMAIYGGTYDYIVDIHTTTTSVEGAIIATNLHGATRKIVNAHDRTTIALMPQELGRQSLIGRFDGIFRGAVSLEYSREFARSEEAHNEVLDCLCRLAHGEQREPRERQVLFIDGLISNDIELDPIVDYNFKLLPDGEHYGFLVGEKAYTTHQGFQADTSVIMRI